MCHAHPAPDDTPPACLALCACPPPGPSAGGSIEPFWGLYQQHQKGEIREILEGMRIGSLKGYVAGSGPKLVDPFVNEPKRWAAPWGWQPRGRAA
jgi:hypothetical protein